MSVLAQLARRGTHAALVVLDAGIHPARTVRRGVGILHDLGVVGRSPEVVTPVRPHPQSAAPQGSAPATPAGPAAPATPAETAAPDGGTGVVGSPTEVEEPVEVDDSAPVRPQGPAPHMPPDIAAEVERDYGDDVPGFTG